MENSMSEEKQRESFIEQWNNSDIKLICEVPVFCRSVDLVAYEKKKRIITAIEFKTTKWKKAVDQVLSTAISFDYLEICVRKPRTMASQERIKDYCSQYGVGIFFFDVDKNEFEHVLKPQKVSKIWKVQKEQVIEFVEKGVALCKK